MLQQAENTSTEHVKGTAVLCARRMGPTVARKKAEDRAIPSPKIVVKAAHRVSFSRAESVASYSTEASLGPAKP